MDMGQTSWRCIGQHHSWMILHHFKKPQFWVQWNPMTLTHTIDDLHVSPALNIDCCRNCLKKRMTLIATAQTFATRPSSCPEPGGMNAGEPDCWKAAQLAMLRGVQQSLVGASTKISNRNWRKHQVACIVLGLQASPGIVWDDSVDFQL